ncbi:hypothetical protein ERJ75_001008900 [Trypanosoma vivax]|nr:hypothetical protein TRVL_06183 [Trypanosoma vivax]KAH8611919.1 hypothetical protein ERJ75_001008900 [Trypanosoma vivax]
MAVHLTPLRRPQLLDLYGLVDSVLQICSASSHHSKRSVTNGSSSAVPPPSDVATGPKAFPGDVGNNLQSSDDMNRGSSNEVKSCLETRADHPFSTGTFCDVFKDPFTCDAWRLYDKMLYLVWWSHRPPCCSNCGMQDAWLPSPDSEARCWNCGAGAGTTALNDIVEDFPVGGGGQGEDVEDANGGMAGGDIYDLGTTFTEGSGNVAAAAGAGAVSLYMFFYEWIARLQAMGCCTGILIPSGENLPMVLRSAYDLATLLVLPGIPGSAASVMWGGALYLSLVLYRFPVPFPLFQLAGRLSRRTSDTSTFAGPDGSMDNVETMEDLQWVDVELLGALIGVALSDLFESSNVATQHLQNVMTVMASFAVPSALWHPMRGEGRMEFIMSLRNRLRPSTCQYISPSSRELSPEHTAMIVVLELARVFDSQPCSVRTSERIGVWLDSNGLYPRRVSYRSSRSEDTADCKSSPAAECPKAKDSQEKSYKSCPPALEDASWSTSPLTTGASPFHCAMQVVLPSPCANALLYMFASAFSLSVLELADMAKRSGIYQGPTRFLEILREATLSGNYTLLPLTRRLSPITSVWTSVYFAVHSSDRLPLLAALQRIRTAATREKEIHATQLIQRIMRKHQASRQFQFNYTIRVDAVKDKPNIEGVYFLSYATERFAVYTSIRSGRKTLTFDNLTDIITFSAMHMKELEVRLATAGDRHVHRHQSPQMGRLPIVVHFNGPIVVHLDTGSAKSVVDCVRQSIGASNWHAAVRQLDRCGRIRRRMRVPMLASRLDALASVREATAVASHPVNGTSTLLGWGETEMLFSEAPPELYVVAKYTAETLRRELQQNVLSLPKPSLVFGMSENRVITMYAALVALLECIDKQQRRRAAEPTAATHRQHGACYGEGLTWLDILLDKGEWDCEWSSTLPTPRMRAVPSPVARGIHISAEASMLLPASTATIKSVQQCNQQEGSRQVPFSTVAATTEGTTFPCYSDVLLGCVDTRGDKGTLTARRIRSSQKILMQQQGLNEANGGGDLRRMATPATNGTSNGERNDEETLPLTCSSFHIFSAEECRKKLYRLLRFVEACKMQRQKHVSSDTNSAHLASSGLNHAHAEPISSEQQTRQNLFAASEKAVPKHTAWSNRKAGGSVSRSQSLRNTPIVKAAPASLPGTEAFSLPPQQPQHSRRRRSSSPTREESNKINRTANNHSNNIQDTLSTSSTSSRASVERVRGSSDPALKKVRRR